MKPLYQNWIDDVSDPAEAIAVEPSPIGFEQILPLSRSHRMEHPHLGIRDDVPSKDVDALRREGWRLLLTNEDFIELVHLQAWYFQAQFFPKLRWAILDAPPGWYFIIGDRPVVWGVDGVIDVQPRFLRHPDVQLFATLTRSVALFAYNPTGPPPNPVPVRDVNRIIAMAASDWIAGPTRSVVVEALADRAGY